MAEWMQLKEFHDWKHTDMIPPKGEVMVWDMATQQDYKVVFNHEEHCPSKGYSHWRPVLEKPKDPLDILSVMAGVLQGKKYKRPTWFDQNRTYPKACYKDKPKEDYTLSRVDIMATDWIEVE